MDETNNQQKENRTSSPMLSRSAQILQAAAPYLDPDSTQMLESVVRMTDFIETIQNLRQHGFSSLIRRLRPGTDTVSMTNLSQAQPQIDSEALLRSIRPFCSYREGVMIDQIMNIFNIQRAINMYQTISNIMSMMNGSDNSNSGNPTNFSPFGNMNGDMSQMMNMAAIMNQMMKGNTDTASNDNNFTDNSYESQDETSSKDETSSDDDCDLNNENRPDNYISQTTDKTSPNESIFQTNPTEDFIDGTTQDTYWNSQNMNYRHSYEPEPDISSSNTASSVTARDDTIPVQPTTDQPMKSNNSSKQMIDMLSTMIPPEQKNTLEAMRILIEAGIIK